MQIQWFIMVQDMIYSCFPSTGEVAIFCHRLSGGMPVNDAGWQGQCLVKQWHVRTRSVPSSSERLLNLSCKDRSLLGHLFVFWLLWAFGSQCSRRLVSRERLSPGVFLWMDLIWILVHALRFLSHCALGAELQKQLCASQFSHGFSLPVGWRNVKSLMWLPCHIHRKCCLC